MQGIRPAVSGLISSAGFSIALLVLFGSSTLTALKAGVNFDLIALVIAILAFIGVRKTKINSIIITLLSGVLGLMLYSIF
jgi:chromate transporter